MANCGPCGTTPTNTPTCESLPSQIENFTLQFFGEVTKTEVNGEVQWLLPCGLDVGLENNPRLAGEGLACYFLRLFRDGIIGATGPQGETGPAGANGIPAISTTMSSFEQPTEGDPLRQVKIAYNPAFTAGLFIFIETSGWYQILSSDNTGILQLQLSKGLEGAQGVISAGKRTIPSGYPGNSIVGATGPQGPQGIQGAPGLTLTTSNGMFNTNVGTDYLLQTTYTALNLVTGVAGVLLPATGTYLLTAIVPVDAEATIIPGDVVAIKMYDTTISGEVAGSEQRVNHFEIGERKNVVLNVIYRTNQANQQVTLFGSCTTSDAAKVIANHITFTYVRLA